MNKIIKKLLFCILIFPIVINAKTYSDAETISNSYLKNNYLSTYDNYFLSNIGQENIKENYCQARIDTGGLLSYNEFLLTTYKYTKEEKNGNEIIIRTEKNDPSFSYLYDGYDFWTCSKVSGSTNKYYIVNDSNSNSEDSVKKNTEHSNLKVIEYVKPDTEVVGSGKLNDPWIFVNVPKITLKSNSYGKIKKDGMEYYTKQLEFYKGKGKIYLLPNDGYKYLGVSKNCKNLFKYNQSNNSGSSYIEVDSNSKISNDIVCDVIFGKTTDKVELVDVGDGIIHASPNILYLLYSYGWYSDEAGVNKISKITPPRRTGYIFNGYYSSDNNLVIDKTGKIDQNKNKTKGNLTSKFNPIKYKIAFNSNYGSGKMNDIICTYDEECILPSNKFTKVGTKFVGWTVAIDGKEYEFSNQATVKNLTSINNKTVILTAKWNGCDAGKYLNSSHVCVDCPENTYSDEGKVNYFNCPKGYLSAKGSKSINSCYINIPDGKYLAKANTDTILNCSAGKYKSAHKVYYGNTSSCNSCPENYTSYSGKSSINDCYMNVPAGNYVKTSKNTYYTECSKGKYKSSHKVYYGNNSKCNSCAACKTTNSTGATSSSYCVDNYGPSDGSNNKLVNGHGGKLMVNCEKPLEVNPSIYDSYNWGNYRTEDWYAYGNHGYCSSNNITTYGFRRYWLSVKAMPYFDSIPVTSSGDNYGDDYETCNSYPLYDSVDSQYGYVYSGTNNYWFDSTISGEKTVFLNIRGDGASSAWFNNLNFYVNGNSYTLDQMVKNKYIKPLVIVDGVNVGNSLNLYTGKSTNYSSYPSIVVMFMTNSGYNISGFKLYSSESFNYSYDSGYGYDVIVADGYYLRVADTSKWKMTYK